MADLQFTSELLLKASQGEADACDQIAARCRRLLTAWLAALSPPPLARPADQQALLEEIDRLLRDDLPGLVSPRSDTRTIVETVHALDQWLLMTVRKQIFNKLTERYCERVLRIIYHKLPNHWRNARREEDVWQETLVRAFQKFPDFHWRSEGEFLAWLTQIARGLIRDKPVEPILASTLQTERDSEFLNQVTQPKASSRYSKQQKGIRRLRLAIAQVLTEKERTVLCEHVFEGKADAKIAEEMQITHGNVRQTRHHAIKKLKQHFEGESLSSTFT